MDARLLQRAEELAGQMAVQVRSIEDVNQMMRLMSKTLIERARFTYEKRSVVVRTVPGTGQGDRAHAPLGDRARGLDHGAVAAHGVGQKVVSAPDGLQAAQRAGSESGLRRGGGDLAKTI